MSRRRNAVRRPLVPDPKYNSPLVTCLVNVVMKNGKKTTAQRIVYNAMDVLGEKSQSNRSSSSEMSSSDTDFR